MATSTLLGNSKFEELCRLCASKTEMVLSVQIFEGEGPMRQLSKKIDTCLHLQVHQQDELPKIVCEDCLYKLEMFWDFKDRSFRAEQLLIELYKELRSESSRNDESSVVSMDSNGLILVPHHQILGDELHGVTDIDISQLGQRDSPENYAIILQHHADLGGHSLGALDLNSHDLTGQELSNQSLHGQENLVVTSGGPDIQGDQRFTDDNLSLMQHHLLGDPQFRLQHDLHVSMGPDDDDLVPYRLPENLKQGLSHPHDQNYVDKPEESRGLDTIDYSNTKTSLAVDANLSDNSLGVEVDSHLTRIISYSSDSQIDQLRHDESSSGGNLLGDDEISSVNAVIDKQGYLLNSDEIGPTDTEGLLQLNSIFYTCSFCGKSFHQRHIFESHYQSHFSITDLKKDSLDLEKNEYCDKLDNTALNSEDNSKSSDAVEQKFSNTKEDTWDSNDGFDNEDSNSIDNPPTPLATKPKNPPLADSSNSDQLKTNSPEGKNGLKICTECGNSYKTNYKLQEHMRKHTGERPFKCKSCDKSFRSKIGLAQHEATHTGQFAFSCSTCRKGFQCKSYLMVHQRVHSDIKPYLCTTCGQNFKTKQSLLDHTNRHLGVKPFLCNICGRGFITKGVCKAHEKTHSGTDNRKYSCKLCNKKFASKSYLVTHSRIHTGEKPFMCEVCGKGLSTRVDLKIHSTLHTGEKSYVCEMCGKAFARRDALRCHRRSHTGERPYSCDLCGQTFTQFTPMAIHKRIHTGEKPYACETCQRKFISRSSMIAHAKKHVKKEDGGKKVVHGKKVDNGKKVGLKQEKVEHF